MKRTALAIFALITLACGGTTGSDPDATCDEVDYRDAHYKECVGSEEYAEHKAQVIEMVKQLRDAESDPASMEDTHDCDAMPIHVCTDGDATRCEWAAHRDGSGAKYEAACICMSEYKYQQVKGSCDGV
jgi:hypothetical protein